MSLANGGDAWLGVAELEVAELGEAGAEAADSPESSEATGSASTES